MGASAGLIGSINPSLPIVTSSGNPFALSGGGTLTSAPINVSSPGANTATGTASLGIYFWIAVGVIGVIIFVKGLI